MKVSLIQMNSVSDKKANIDKAERLARAAIRNDGSDMVMFPEHFDWAGGSTEEKIAAGEPERGGPAYSMCRKLAIDCGAYVHSGSFYEMTASGNKVYNTSVMFNPHGEEIARYRKIHLFDIYTPDGLRYGESDAVAPGESIVVADVGNFKIGLAICYDLRFPELFEQLVKKGANVLVLPAAFTLQTGKDHWEVLCRARAIESQCYFLAPGSQGPFKQGNEVRHTYGQSLIVDPWGHVIAKASDGDGYATATMSLDRIQEVRAQIPIAKHKVL